MNGDILLMELVALFFQNGSILHIPSGRQAGIHPHQRQLSIHLLLIIKPEGHCISEKVTPILEKGILAGVTSRLNLFESHRQGTVLRNGIFQLFLEETHILCWKITLQNEETGKKLTHSLYLPHKTNIVTPAATSIWEVTRDKYEQMTVGARGERKRLREALWETQEEYREYGK